MCRLYGFRATAPTKAACALVHAPNALMVQSRKDQAGLSHTHGWGIATYSNGVPHVERQTRAAYQDEAFCRAAARADSRTVVAHVRRASIGAVCRDNTHPFVHGRWVFAHNGTLGAFTKMRAWMLEAMRPEHRKAIRGTTDSEHIFHFLMSLSVQHAEHTPLTTLRMGLRQLLAWSHEADATAVIGLNVLLSNGEELAGSRWGRTLWYLEQDRRQDCEICGFSPIRHDPHGSYRAAVIASEPISHGPWREAPEGTLFDITPDMRVRFEPLL